MPNLPKNSGGFRFGNETNPYIFSMYIKVINALLLFTTFILACLLPTLAVIQVAGTTLTFTLADFAYLGAGIALIFVNGGEFTVLMFMSRAVSQDRIQFDDIQYRTLRITARIEMAFFLYRLAECTALFSYYTYILLDQCNGRTVACGMLIMFGPGIICVALLSLQIIRSHVILSAICMDNYGVFVDMVRQHFVEPVSSAPTGESFMPDQPVIGRRISKRSKVGRHLVKQEPVVRTDERRLTELKTSVKLPEGNVDVETAGDGLIDDRQLPAKGIE